MTFTEATWYILPIYQFSVIQYILLAIYLCSIFCVIYYIIPYVHITIKKKNTERAKKARSLLIKQIAMQKDIDDEIEKELNINH